MDQNSGIYVADTIKNSGNSGKFSIFHRQLVNLSSKTWFFLPSSGSRNRLTIKNNSWGSLMKVGIQRDEKP
jgi:hypothetical protein